MALVNVFGNTYLNPEAVGKVEFEVTTSETMRSWTTLVFDMTGQNLLLKAHTSVPLEVPPTDPYLVKRDNHIHEQIVIAISESKNAQVWNDSLAK